jgi:phage-related minor tail protein
MVTHLFFAAETTLERLQKIPKDFWLKMGAGILGVIIVFIIIQKVLKINKFILGGVIFIGGGLMWFNWIYHRTEPKFLTPLVDRIAPFFPSAGSYDAKQATNPGDTKK